MIFQKAKLIKKVCIFDNKLFYLHFKIKCNYEKNSNSNNSFSGRFCLSKLQKRL